MGPANLRVIMESVLMRTIDAMGTMIAIETTMILVMKTTATVCIMY